MALPQFHFLLMTRIFSFFLILILSHKVIFNRKNNLLHCKTCRKKSLSRVEGLVKQTLLTSVSDVVMPQRKWACCSFRSLSLGHLAQRSSFKTQAGSSSITTATAKAPLFECLTSSCMNTSRFAGEVRLIFLLLNWMHQPFEKYKMTCALCVSHRWRRSRKQSRARCQTGNLLAHKERWSWHLQTKLTSLYALVSYDPIHGIDDG